MKYRAIGSMLLILSGCFGETPAPQQTPAPAAAAAKPADENAALRAIEEINQAQEGYMKRNRRYALTYDELIESHLMQQEPSKDATGYEIKLRPAADAGSYRVVATPSTPSPTSRYFFTDKTGVVRAEQGKEATADSPPVSK